MSFNKIIGVCGGFPLADKSAMAAINRALRVAASVHHTPVISLKFIIAPLLIRYKGTCSPFVDNAPR